MLRVPPLRERLSDVPALVDHLLQTIASHLRVRPKTIAPDALALLAGYDWRKNNVRELRNCLERMMIASDAAVIVAADAPPEIRGDERDEASDPAAAPGTLKALKAQAERQIVVAALEKHGWHVTKTAEALGLADHSSLLKIMRRHGLKSQQLVDRSRVPRSPADHRAVSDPAMGTAEPDTSVSRRTREPR